MPSVGGGAYTHTGQSFVSGGGGGRTVVSDRENVAMFILLLCAATAFFIYAFTKLQSAASEEDLETAVVLLCLGVLIYLLFLRTFYTRHAAWKAAKAARAAKEARAPCELVRSKTIEMMMGKVAYDRRTSLASLRNEEDGKRDSADNRSSYFAMFDKNNDNKISKREFVLGLQALGVELEEGTYLACFYMLDRDQTGWLSPKEFAVFLASGLLPEEQRPEVESPTGGKDRGKTKDGGNIDPSRRVDTDLPGTVVKAVED